MSLASWYHHKAAQCEQMAKDATEPHRRASYEHEQVLWVQMAERIDAEETNQLEADRK